MPGKSSPHLSLENAMLLYAAAYFLVALGVHLAFFPIGDIGVETDFFGDLVVAAQKLVLRDFSVASYPYKGPFYSFALVFVRLFVRDWYLSGVVLNGLCAAASLIVIFRTLVKLYGRTTAFLATIAVSLGSQYFILAHKASSDMLFLFLCYSAINILFMDAFSWRRVIGAGILSAFAFLTRYTGIFLPAALVAMSLVNPWGWPWRRRLAAVSAYAVAFLVVCAPWLVKNVDEAGSLLATRNVDTVVEEFYGGPRATAIPAGGFASIRQVIVHDPAHFIRHYLFNIARHLWLDMWNLLGVELAILVYFAVLRMLFRPPTRKQWAFLVFAACFLLVISAAFFLPRFSLPLTPVYYAILFSMLIALQGMRRFPLAAELDLLRAQRSDAARKERAAAQKGSRKGKTAPTLTPARAVTVCIVALVFILHVRSVVETEKRYYDQRPMYILEAARFLKAHEAERRRTEKAIVMARKPHIAYYSDMTYRQYPQSISYIREIVDHARSQGVSYLVLSDIERSYTGDSKGWQRLGMIEGVETIYTKPSITIYELAF